MRSSVMTLLTSSLVFTMGANAMPQPPIPPPGLFCCPPTGPNGLVLLEQQVGPYAIWCMSVLALCLSWRISDREFGDSYGDNIYCAYVSIRQEDV